jgi:hypothetical protein
MSRLSDEELQALLKQTTGYTLAQRKAIAEKLDYENGQLNASVQKQESERAKVTKGSKQLDEREAKIREEELKLNEDVQLLEQYTVAFEKEKEEMEAKNAEEMKDRMVLDLSSHCYLGPLITKKDFTNLGYNPSLRSEKNIKTGLLYISASTEDGKLVCESSFPESYVLSNVL